MDDPDFHYDSIDTPRQSNNLSPPNSFNSESWWITLFQRVKRDGGEDPQSSTETGEVDNSEDLPKGLLSTLTNRFNDPNMEESYQLYCSQDITRAQIILFILLTTHLCGLFLYTYLVRFHEILNTRDYFIEEDILDFEWLQYVYLALAVPFIFIPLTTLGSIGGCRIGVYYFRKLWKPILAFTILLFTIGIICLVCSKGAIYMHFYGAFLQSTKLAYNHENTQMSDSYFQYLDARAFLWKKDMRLHTEIISLLSMLVIVFQCALTITMRMDFMHGLSVSVFSCVTFWGIFNFSPVVKKRRSTPIAFLVVVPITLLLAAMYRSDRLSRISYYMKLQMERTNTELKSNLHTTRKNLANKSVTSNEKAVVEDLLLNKESSLLEDVAISFADINLQSEIGRGASSEVLLADYFGTPVAVKRLSRTLINRQELTRFRNQVELLACLRHPNIVQFIGASWDSIANICLVMEYMEGGDVKSLLNKKHAIQLTWDDPLLKIATDAAQGMAYLHNSEMPIVHRDLKSTNLLCSRTFSCKIADFGASRRQEEMLKSICGTPFWLAPEVLREEPYGCKSDCYSFGMVLVELETQKDPYYDLETTNPVDIMMLVAHGKLLPSIPPTCLPKRRQLILDCLNINPSERPSMPMILSRLQGDIQQELQSQANTGPGANALLRRRKLLRRQSRLDGSKLMALQNADSGEE